MVLLVCIHPVLTNVTCVCVSSKVALVTEASVKHPCLSLIYDLRSFTFLSLCLMFIGVVAVAGQFDSTNSVLAQGDNGSSSFLNFSNISGIDFGIISSMNQTNEPGELDESNVSSNSENQTSAPKLP
jgi:hypothetical protein